VSDAEAKVALTTTSLLDNIENHCAKNQELRALCVRATDKIASNLASGWQEPDASSNTLAFLQYTSGSTGTPKGVMVSHGNLLHNSEYIRRAFELTPESVSVTWLPNFHDMGLIDGIIQPLYTGFLGVLIPPGFFIQQPFLWLQAVTRYRATHCGAPNFAYELCVQKITPQQRETLDLSSWQSAYNGAEPVRRETLEQFTKTFASCGFRTNFFYPCYGMAESTLMISGGLVKDEPIYCAVKAEALEQHQILEISQEAQNIRDLVGCGRTWLDIKIVIADPQLLMRCPPNQVGEIWVSGSSVAQGYWNRPEQTEKTFRAYLADTGEGPFLRTGDLGFLRDGELFVTGRIKDLLIIRGRNHYPQDIELTVEQSHQALRQGCGAVVDLLVEGEERLLVIQEIERSYLRQLNVEEVVRAIRQSVAQKHELQVYAVALLKTGSIPKTSSGKIQRHACRKGFLTGTLDEVGRSVLKQWNELETEAELSREECFAMSQNDCQQQLLNYMQKQVARLLKIAPSQLYSEQPLSQLGLDSLRALEFKHYLETHLGVTVAIADLLQGFTVKQLTAKVLVQMQNSFLQPSTAFVPLSELAVEYPLSQGQIALWFLHQLSPKSSAYNTFFAARIISDLDVAALRQVFQVLSDRHSAIRVTFNIFNEQPVQQVQKQLQLIFEEIDATQWSQDELNEQLSKSAHHAFNLAQELPMQVSLFRRGVGEDILLLIAHHIALDFWSLEVLLDEIRILYPQIKVGLPILPTLDWQYADYVRWQADMLAGHKGEQLWSYWQKQLTGELPVLNLPTDRPRVPMQTYQGAVQTFHLERDLVERLKVLTQKEGVTLYMLLLAAFQVLLYRYTSQEDILVGSPTAGRSRTELSEIVGYFVNPVVLRVNLSQNPTFEEFLAQVRQVVVEALDHQDYPFSLLVKRLQPERDLSYSPLFQVMFVFDKSQRVDNLTAFLSGKNGFRLDLGGLLLESLAVEQRVALFDLTLTMLEVEEGLVGSWQYNSDLFDVSTIARMAEHFQNLLVSIVANPQHHVQELPLVSAAEQHQLLVEWNNTQDEYLQNQCIYQLFEAQVERTPDAIALVFEKQQLTYQELNCRANQLAQYLRGLEVGTETLVGICIERSIEMVVGLLGILKAGGAYVPLDPTYPQERLALMLSDTQLQVLLTSEKLIAGLPKHSARVVLLDRDWKAISQEKQYNLITNTKPTNLAYILYTSGSTGQPKGVAIEHRSTVNFLHWARKVYTSEQLAGVLASTSINFDLSVFELFVPLCWGGRVILAENALHLPTLPAAENVTLLNTVPSAITELLRMNGIPDGVQTFNLAGEPLPHQLVQQLYQHHPSTQVFNLYGPTEATTYATFTLVQKGGSKSPTIGRPIANTQVYILDSHLQPVPIGIVGELYIGGAGLARDYFQRPDLTFEKFILNSFSNQPDARLYKTGDLARYLSDGNIEFLGRRDHQVKIRGFRIELGEIEAVLTQHPMVQETVVLVREHSGEHRLVAYVVPQQKPSVLNELRYFLKQKLPQYMIPLAFVSLDSLPLTPNGKIDRRALPNPEAYPKMVGTDAIAQTKAEQLIAAVWQEILHLEKVSIYDNFFDIGGHSLLMVQVRSRLEEIFKRNILIVDMFKHPTVSSLAIHITQEKKKPFLSDIRKQYIHKLSNNQDHHNLDIAIIGMSCRFPGATSIKEFWENLRNGVESISAFSDEELLVAGVELGILNNPNYVKNRAVLPDIELFDAAFFGCSPKEAKTIDPQHRLFLEIAWEALESAGYNPKACASKIGAYAGVGMNTYLLNNLYYNRDILDSVGEYQLMIGNDKDFLPTRISYKLNLNGPSVNVQTACSTSLVAVHLACKSLHDGECDMALAGGVSIRVPQQAGYLYQEGMILSPDGHCRAFDSQSQGTVPGNGLGIVVLKRLADAIADGDCIHAIIKGSAINNDGSVKVGYTAPGVDGQAAVIADAQAIAGVDPETITYIEAHGTGTVLGDPIEIAALTQVFQKSTQKQGFCAIGSVKTNIGHLDAAAGIAGLLKAILALKHKLLPPSLHFEQPNPQIDFANSPFYVNTELCEWKTDGIPRRAGVSSFGIGGTNAHIVLEEAAEEIQNLKFKIQKEDVTERPLHLLTLSAKSEQALEELTLKYQEYLANHFETNLTDICFTANVGRSHFEYRLAIVAESAWQLHEHLAAFVNGITTNEVLRGTSSLHTPEIAFLFTGQGAQYVGMGQQLYQTQPTFRAAIDRCNQILRPYLETPLLEVLYPDTQSSHPQSPIPNPQLDETAYTQPALFALEYALYQLWKSWGITPKTVMGHSVGEYVAACVAGVFSLEDGLKLIAARGRLMQALPKDGEMVAVLANEQQVSTAIQDYREEVALAAINSPHNIVISGKFSAVAAVSATLQAQGIETKKLPVSHAFHSPLMEPILAEFEQVAQQVTYSLPHLNIVSNVTGKLITEEIATAQYWSRHLRQPVKFAAGMATLDELGYEIFVEIGPKPTLLAMGHQCLAEKERTWLPSLHPKHSDWQQILQSLSKLYISGVNVDWSGFDRDYQRRRVMLPTYPFQRQRYWVDAPTNKHKTQEQSQTPIVNLLHQGDIKQLTHLLEKGNNFSPEQRTLLPDLLSVLVKQHQQELKAASIKDWFYHLEWQAKPRQLPTILEPTQTLKPGIWLILADQQGVGQRLAKLLEKLGHRCFLVFVGNTYKTEENATWIINPSRLDHFEILLQKTLSTLDLPFQGVVHLWSLEAAPTENLTIPALEQAEILNCGSVLYLVQALVEQNGLVSPRLWLATKGAVPIEPGDKSVAVAQSSVWGLGKVIALEHPQLWGGMIDLAPDALLDDAATRLLEEIGNSEGEDHLAFRGGQRYVARLKQSRVPESQVQLRTDSSYLITGGLGALGLKVARWMVEQGAKHLILTSRHAASIAEQETLNQIEQAGGKILVAQADVSLQEDMVKLFEEIKTTMPPLRGIIHAAGVLNDGILQSQNWERFTQTLAPKVQGTWNLHTLTQKLPLDFFILFSSAASLLGSPGQGNYAAANAFMDALAQYRQRLGLVGLSINWGQWAETGMSANVSSHHQARLAEQGFNSIASEQGLQVLESLLGSNSAQMGVLVVNWSLFKQKLPLLSDLMSEISLPEIVKQTTKRQDFLERLEKIPISDRQDVLINHIQEQVSKMLGLKSSQLKRDQGFADMGMDSLIAIEFRNHLENSLGLSLPATLVFEYPTIKSLAEYITTKLLKWQLIQIVDEDSPQTEDKLGMVLSEIEQLTEAEIQAAIAKEMAELESLLKGKPT
jgi:amino acid adenylation domain-containing protein